jgi:hypothetical protein
LEYQTEKTVCERLFLGRVAELFPDDNSLPIVKGLLTINQELKTAEEQSIGQVSGVPGTLHSKEGLLINLSPELKAFCTEPRTLLSMRSLVIIPKALLEVKKRHPELTAKCVQYHSEMITCIKLIPEHVYEIFRHDLRFSVRRVKDLIIALVEKCVLVEVSFSQSPPRRIQS